MYTSHVLIDYTKQLTVQTMSYDYYNV